jgi:hypothetical protein
MLFGRLSVCTLRWLVHSQLTCAEHASTSTLVCTGQSDDHAPKVYVKSTSQHGSGRVLVSKLRLLEQLQPSAAGQLSISVTLCSACPHVDGHTGYVYL